MSNEKQEQLWNEFWKIFNTSHDPNTVDNLQEQFTISRNLTPASVEQPKQDIGDDFAKGLLRTSSANELGFFSQRGNDDLMNEYFLGRMGYIWFIEETATQLWLTESGGWTNNPLKAYQFKSQGMAASERITKNLSSKLYTETEHEFLKEPEQPSEGPPLGYLKLDKLTSEETATFLKLWDKVEEIKFQPIGKGSGPSVDGELLAKIDERIKQVIYDDVGNNEETCEVSTQSYCEALEWVKKLIGAEGGSESKEGGGS